MAAATDVKNLAFQSIDRVNKGYKSAKSGGIMGLTDNDAPLLVHPDSAHIGLNREGLRCFSVRNTGVLMTCSCVQQLVSIWPSKYK